MRTQLWLFPTGEEINLQQYPKEILRCMKLVQPQELTLGEHKIELVGLVDQGNDYAVNVQEQFVQLFVTGKPGFQSKIGEGGKLLQDRVFTLPKEGKLIPIMSGKYDKKMYLFALIAVDLF